jgi:potassium/chloride transporter 4/5/6
MSQDAIELVVVGDEDVANRNKSLIKDKLSWDGEKVDGKFKSMLEHVREGGSTKLGTVMGVFVPTVQNILGIILFLRLPRITGHAGIGGGIAVVLLGCSASLLTSLSMSAIATNGVPKGGGCFSIIKESIGPEFGGTIGCLLYLSNCFGLAMYVLAFVEILQGWATNLSEWPSEAYSGRFLGVITMAGLFTIVYIGISYISKAALVFLSGVVLSILSIWAGTIEHAVVGEPNNGMPGMSMSLIAKNAGPGYREPYSFGVCLAIFFPAVTDPLAGSNLSGDLKDPQGSIPPGTIAAVLVTTLIFCMQVLFAGGSCDRDTLIKDNLIISKLAWPRPWLVLLGMCMSTLGAGLQSLAGAPRLLAAIGKEGILPPLKYFSPAPGAEPRRAVVLCAFLSTCAVMIGELDYVAPFITMWFLTSYGIINGACAFLAYERSPSFRPTFKYYDWRLSMVGCIQCFGMMFFCAPKLYFAGDFALLACFISTGIYFYIQRQVHIDELHGSHNISKISLPEEEADEALKGHVDWRSGRRFTAARQSLLALKQGDMDFKYWRPFVLFLAKINEEDGDYVPQQGMLHLVCQMMKRGKGLSIIAGVVEGNFEEKVSVVDGARLFMEKAMADRGIEGFPEVIPARTRYEGYKILVTGKGLGSLRPNTVMLGWPTNICGHNTSAEPDMSDEDEKEFCSLLKYVALAKKTLLICKGSAEFPSSGPAFERERRQAAEAAVPKGKLLSFRTTSAQFEPTEVMTGFIDVWWIFDLFPAKGLLLLLPYLLQQHRVWKPTKTRLFVVCAPSTNTDQLKNLLTTMVAAGGIVADVNVLEVDPDEAPRFQGNTRVLHKKDHALTAALTKYVSEGTGQEPLGRGKKNETAEEPAEEPRLPPSEVVTAKSGMKHILEAHSAQSPLVLVTLPKRCDAQSEHSWLESVEDLVENLQRVIFIQESGHERIQFFKD